MKEITPPVPHVLQETDRVAHHGHAGAVVWLTGLSGSGKSTLAMALEEALTEHGYSCYVLDGDNLRNGLNVDLGFSPADRTENIRRVGEVAALFCDAGLICITAFISPYRSDRERARKAIGNAFHEIHIATDLTVCESRDPKGLYKKARAGILQEFTGISAPYERPHHAEFRLDTAGETVSRSVERLLAYVTDKVPCSDRGS